MNDPNDPVPPPLDYDIPMVCHDTSEFDVAADLGLTSPPSGAEIPKPAVLRQSPEHTVSEPKDTDQQLPEQDKKSA